MQINTRLPRPSGEPGVADDAARNAMQTTGLDGTSENRPRGFKSPLQAGVSETQMQMQAGDDERFGGLWVGTLGSRIDPHVNVFCELHGSGKHFTGTMIWTSKICGGCRRTIIGYFDPKEQACMMKDLSVEPLDPANKAGFCRVDRYAFGNNRKCHATFWMVQSKSLQGRRSSNSNKVPHPVRMMKAKTCNGARAQRATKGKPSFFLQSLLLLACMLSGQAAHAEVRLPAIISNHMLVQADANPRIWGWASPGEKIEVKYPGKTLKTVADANGEWHIFLGKIKAGTKFDLTVSGTNSISVKDVLAGEVWVCAGQSNMEFHLSKAKKR